MLTLNVGVRLQKMFRGQERNGTEKLMGMRVDHVNRKSFCSVLFGGELNKFNFFCPFYTEKTSYDMSSQSDSSVA